MKAIKSNKIFTHKFFLLHENYPLYSSHFMDIIFMVAACTAGIYIKIVKVASFVGKIFVVQCSTTNILPLGNYQLYI